MAQSFDTPENCQPPPPKRHSPSFENVQWDTDQLESTLHNRPTGSPINWSAIARDHNIPGGNGGQVAKAFVMERGIHNKHSQHKRNLQVVVSLSHQIPPLV